MKILHLTFNKKKLPEEFSFLIWLMYLTLMAFFAIYKQELLPDYFFADSDTISDYIKNGAELIKGSSYYSTAYFYGLLNFSNNSIFLSVLSMLFIVLSILTVLSRVASSLSFSGFILLFFYSFLSVIYMTLLSKDLLVFIFCSLLVLFDKRKFTILIWFVIALFYAYWFRTYWFLVLSTTVFTWLVYWRFKSLKYVLYAIIIKLFILAIVFQIGLGVTIDHYRVIVNDVRLSGGTEDARTMILPFIDSSNLFFSWLNVLITWFALGIPFPILKLFTPYYIFLFLMISCLFIFFYKRMVSVCDDFSYKGVLGCIVISFTAIQSIFEPDYGSAIRHLAPFYPLMFYVGLKEQNEA